ncbi:MAG: HAD family hydrolase [Pseudomonadota bacterium]
MELIVFDLDGTLLNRKSRISPYTRETLRRLSERGIAYTVATGRTLHGASDILEGHGFELPQIFKNGVMVWNPKNKAYSRHHLLTLDEVRHVSDAFLERSVTPFIFTLKEDSKLAVFHPPLQQKIEYRLVKSFESEGGTPVLPIHQMTADVRITNVSAVGPETAITAVASSIEDDDHLVAYMGTAIEDQRLSWIDIHHESGSKGGAVEALKDELGFSRVICFGDSENDLTMFESADEAYAPENAKEHVKAAATAVIGHHDADGIAKFLRERFEL